ncbi:MAG TPA: methyltransferase domain-containing protein [Caulobacteraceae bacterium]|jgi:chorismate mutase/predicted O-methyltransferase YrrM
MSDPYVFSHHRDDTERRRLQMLEQVHGPATRRLLRQAGLRPGMACAEVGAGAGDIAAFLAEAAGPAGRVTALDLDPRFLDFAKGGPVEVRQADIQSSHALEPGAFDLIHARFLLVHLERPQQALRTMTAALKPGGVLVLEEPDFRTAASASCNASTRAAVDAVNRAICAMYLRMGRDPGFGLHLPGLTMGEGLDGLTIDIDLPLTVGGSPIATMMGASVGHLRQRLLDTGLADEAAIAAYVAAAEDPGSWATYYATVSVSARKGAAGARTLPDVRADIDALDQRLVALLAARGRLVTEAGSLKASAAEAAAPARAEQVVAQAVESARAAGAPERVVEAVYRTMIAEFTAFERSAIEGRQAGP